MKEQKIVINDTAKFRDIIYRLEESLIKLEDNFNGDKNNIQKLEDDSVWSGKTKDKIFEKYNEISKSYDPIIESLKTYIKFLINTVTSYENLEKTLNTSIADGSEELDVN